MKKLLGLSFIACSLVVLAGCGTKKADVSDMTTPAAVTNPTPNGKTVDATKDQCIELMAYAFKVAQLQASGDTAAMTAWAQKANDIEMKYRDANTEYEQACNKYLSNTADMSFFNDVQKRMKELK